MSSDEKSEFETESEEKHLSLMQEFLVLIVENKKWWLIPILLALGIVGLLVMLASTGAGPLLYPFF